MNKVNYVADLIAEIRHDEDAIALKRDLLDSAWAEMLLEEKACTAAPPSPSGAGNSIE